MRATIRFVTYNVRYFSQGLMGLASTRTCARRITACLASLDPPADVVCLQEFETFSLRSRVAYRGSKGAGTQLELFMSELEEAFTRHGQRSPYRGLYFPAHARRIRNLPLATDGLAVLVRSPELRVEAHNGEAPREITYRRPGRGAEGWQTRICAHVKLVDASGHRIHVFNTHLSLPWPYPRALWWRLPSRLGHSPNQIREARTLARFVRRLAQGEPFVVCGDFNSTWGSRVVRYLTGSAGFRHAEQEVADRSAPGPMPTFGKMGVRVQLDHLFCGGRARWLDLEGSFGFGDPRNTFAGLSDHVPVIGRLDFS